MTTLGIFHLHVDGASHAAEIAARTPDTYSLGEADAEL